MPGFDPSESTYPRGTVFGFTRAQLTSSGFSGGTTWVEPVNFPAQPGPIPPLPLADPQSGAVYRSPAFQIEIPQASNTQPFTQFGFALSCDANFLAVSEPQYQRVFVYHLPQKQIRPYPNFRQLPASFRDNSEPRGTSDDFGSALSVKGGNVYVGAPGASLGVNHGGAGKIYRFGLTNAGSTPTYQLRQVFTNEAPAQSGALGNFMKIAIDDPGENIIAAQSMIVATPPSAGKVSRFRLWDAELPQSNPPLLPGSATAIPPTGGCSLSSSNSGLPLRMEMIGADSSNPANIIVTGIKPGSVLLLAAFLDTNTPLITQPILDGFGMGLQYPPGSGSECHPPLGILTAGFGPVLMFPLWGETHSIDFGLLPKAHINLMAFAVDLFGPSTPHVVGASNVLEVNIGD